MWIFDSFKISSAKLAKKLFLWIPDSIENSKIFRALLLHHFSMTISEYLLCFLLSKLMQKSN